MVYVLAATLYEAVIGHITATNKKGDRHNCVALNMHVLINVGDNEVAIKTGHIWYLGNIVHQTQNKEN